MRYALLVLSALALAPAFGQRDTLAPKQNTLYIEALGTGGLGSLNYERSFWHKGRLSTSARIGISTIHVHDFTRQFNPDLLFPIGAVACFGDRFQAEVSGGVAFTSIVYPDPEDFAPARRGEVQGWLALGGRYQDPGKGWMLRATYTPIIEFGTWRHWGGVSFGHTF
jgi:hypothetical protein